MATPGSYGREFHELKVQAVIRETDESVSIVLAVPPRLREVFDYRAGQFVTLRVPVDGEAHLRSYSMSSAPGVDRDLQVTVKRVAGGVVSNRLVDRLRCDDVLDVWPPGGSFVLDESESDGDVVAFAAGSGITPVFSLLKHVLATTDRRFSLLYANRDRSSTIFADALDLLAAEHPGRLQLEYHFDEEKGFVDGATVSAFTGQRLGAEFLVCGPTPFMDAVEGTLMWSGVPRQRLHLERFTPADQEPSPGRTDGIEVTISLEGRTVTASHRHRATILQTARSAGLQAPSSCETGTCATCMALVSEGRVEMRHNGALTSDEVAAGWVLTCQAVPVTPSVKVVYQ